MQLLMPLLTRKIEREMTSEWQYLHDDVLDPEILKLEKGLYTNVSNTVLVRHVHVSLHEVRWWQ